MKQLGHLFLLSLAGCAAALCGACSTSSDELFGYPGSGASAGTGAGGGSTTTTTSTGATGGSGGSAGSEDCLNGLDDDGNGLTDCDDPACTGAGYSCVPTVPGAQQYLVPTAQACPASTVATSLVSCQGCDCAPAAGTCSVAMISYLEATCAQPYAYPYGCAYASPGGQRWYTATTTSDGTAGCVPSPAQVLPSVQPSCALAEPGHCANGLGCVPPPFLSSQPCVLLDAGMSCPGEYPIARPISLGGAQCTCGCNTTDVACDTPVVSVDATDTACSAVTSEVPVLPSCTPIGFIQSVNIPATVTASPVCVSSSLLDGQQPSNVLCCQP